MKETRLNFKVFTGCLLTIFLVLSLLLSGCNPGEVTTTLTTTSTLTSNQTQTASTITTTSTATDVVTHTVTTRPMTVVTTLTQTVTPTPTETVIVAEDITPNQAYSLTLENINNPEFVILDVRTFEEYITGHLEGSALVDIQSDGWLPTIKALNRNYTYLLY